MSIDPTPILNKVTSPYDVLIQVFRTELFITVQFGNLK